MRLAYIDETARADVYFVVALVVGDECVQALDRALAEVVTVAAEATGGPVTELHGFPLFQGEGEWSGVPPRLRISIYDQAMRVIGAHPVAVLASGAHVPGLKVRYGQDAWHPHDVCLRRLLECVDDYAERRGEPALVIADDVGKDDRLRHRQNLEEIRKVGTGGKANSFLPRIVDTIHFAPSHHSRLLQAVDLIAFMLQRRLHNEERAEPRELRANTRIWARIEDRVVDSTLWCPHPVPGRRVPVPQSTKAPRP